MRKLFVLTLKNSVVRDTHGWRAREGEISHRYNQQDCDGKKKPTHATTMLYLPKVRNSAMLSLLDKPLFENTLYEG